MPTRPSSSSEQPPCDFLAFLSAELGIEASDAAEVLGDWLLRYEPGPFARSHGSLAPRKVERTKTAAPCVDRDAA